MSFENWTIEDLIARCTDFDEMTLEMDREEFAALRRMITKLRQAGNSPVIPDGYVMVPKEMTDEIGEAIAMQANCCGGIALDIYDAMLAAAPQEVK
ncbi:TPA: hypothetical protein ACH270_005409 [Klebsiella oxytoca]